eukprot:TRINITY_DN23094_c0_g1_i1.p1 TRINITY_DN23094_c0_g1~~TRINITY_DN23094_c0_g1_i1.p1  ORF type:complete len:257 (+),score=54.97 TRINITY_DN23094_c0_g1_i1:58-828(+)
MESPLQDGIVSIQIISFSGAELAQLQASVEDTVFSVKKKVVEALGHSRWMEVELLLDSEELPHAGTLAAAGLRSGESYVLNCTLSQHWILDDSKKGDGVVLVEENVVENTVGPVASDCSPGSCRVILGTSPIPKGRHHFIVRLVEGSYYYIGVAEENVNRNTWLGNEIGRGWSYYLKDDKSGSRLGPGYRDCGPRLYRGDTVRFCFDTEEGTLEYAQNGEAYKLAETGLAGKDLYLALGMGPNGVRLKLEDAWRER